MFKVMNRATAEYLNAFISIVDDPGAGGPGPLSGVPVAVKDLIDVAGMRTTAGSAILRDAVAKSDSACVRALRKAGAVIVGKTNTHEFAYGTTNDNPHYGATRNPWNPALSTGGSSGGSAAAVAAGIVPLALGTDTAGSIRIPAALCGAVGLKPTTGLVSTSGVIPLSRTLDCVGPIAQTVDLARLALEAMTGEVLTREVGVRGLRIGVPEHWVFDRVHPDVEAVVRQALRAMERLGCVLETVVIPELAECERIGIAIVRPEAGTWHRQWFPSRAAEYGADVRVKLAAGQALPAKDYLVAQEDRERVRKALRRVLKRVDLLAGPTVPVPAFLNSDAPIADTYRLTYPWNIAFLPAVTVPCGFTSAALPVGLQLAGAPRSEARLLAAAAAYEEARGAWPLPALAQGPPPHQN
jgi:aspartyl-tRNA(Asn)/glutamyl-tRNA(Gln) amidotransferase subunit A